jgi:F0F1-type ATP synthase membrane subunit b/b'
LLNDRESVIQDARNESGRIIELANAEAAVLVSQEQVYKSALAEVERLRTANDDEMARKRRELDDYIDAKLAAFEAALVKTLNAVQVGRERTAVRLASDLPPDTNHDPGNFFGDWADPRA